jgi:hypothetical protein
VCRERGVERFFVYYEGQFIITDKGKDGRGGGKVSVL